MTSQQEGQPYRGWVDLRRTPSHELRDIFADEANRGCRINIRTNPFDPEWSTSMEFTDLFGLLS
jgi:hypothetical protein